jgi:hypothetical protein
MYELTVLTTYENSQLHTELYRQLGGMYMKESALEELLERPIKHLARDKCFLCQLLLG